MTTRISMLFLLTILAIFSGVALAQDSEILGVSEVQVVAIYFHGTLRCQTCLGIEERARYDVEMDLAPDLSAGRLAWQTVNFDEPQNAHYFDKFDLEAPTLVLTLLVEGTLTQWVKLEKTWDLYEDTKAFDAYVLGEVGKYLEAASLARDKAQGILK